jgi:hypothetical protein
VRCSSPNTGSTASFLAECQELSDRSSLDCMTEQLRTAASVQGRSAHGGISRDFRQNRPKDVSGTSAFAAETHSDWRFASVFVTAPDGLTLHVAGIGLASLPPFQLYAYLVSPGLQRTFILWQRGWRPTPPSRGLSWRSIIAATAGPNTIAILTTTRFPSHSPTSRPS